MFPYTIINHLVRNNYLLILRLRAGTVKNIIVSHIYIRLYVSMNHYEVVILIVIMLHCLQSSEDEIVTLESALQ